MRLQFNILCYVLFIWLCSFTIGTEKCFGQFKNDDFEFNVNSKQTIENPDSLFLQLKKKNSEAINSGNVILQGTSLRDMGEICYHLGHYAMALEYFIDAKNIFEKLQRNDLLADNYNKTGTLYYYNRDTLNARHSYEKAMQLYTGLNDQLGIALTLGKMGHLLEKKQLYDSAFIYQRRALDAYKAINDKKGSAHIYENMGSIYEDLGNYNEAMTYFQSALNIYEQSGQEIQSIEVVNNLGDIYRKTGNYKKAMEQTLKALKLARKHNELYQISSAYRDISKTYNLMGKNDSAFHYAETARGYLMEIYSRENNRQMAFLHALNDAEKKNEQIRTLQNERRVNIIITVATVLIIILLIVAGFSLVSRHRILLKSTQQASEQQMKILETQQRLMEAGLRNKEMEETQLKQEIELKSKELSTHVLHVIQKNQLLEGLKAQLEEMVKEDKRDQKKQLRQIINQINQDFNNDSYWSDFSTVFEQIHQSFFENLNQQFPKLTSTDLRLISLLKMNMDSNDMAAMLAISQDSLRIARYRLRKKLNLDQGENLVAFLQSF
ncbi:tetratricopeptide repeat protein [Pedobacter sp. AW31-3R]|uniref:tetratricopeptide repeat protein n=1 Tax=Pedobacter sp. AW31-3R TaxID=3445781 RepID=UPI003F9FB80D